MAPFERLCVKLGGRLLDLCAQLHGYMGHSPALIKYTTPATVFLLFGTHFRFRQGRRQRQSAFKLLKPDGAKACAANAVKHFENLLWLFLRMIYLSNSVHHWHKTARNLFLFQEVDNTYGKSLTTETDRLKLIITLHSSEGRKRWRNPHEFWFCVPICSTWFVNSQPEKRNVPTIAPNFVVTSNEYVDDRNLYCYLPSYRCTNYGLLEKIFFF